MIFGVGLFCAGILLALQAIERRPIRVDLLVRSDAPERPGEAVLDGGPGDVLLVVDLASIRAAAERDRFSRADWSYAWLDLLRQEAGGVRTVDAGDLEAALAHPRRMVVVTRSARWREDLVAALDAYARAGGRVVLEQPEARLADLAGAGPGVLPAHLDGFLGVTWPSEDVLANRALERLRGVRLVDAALDEGVETVWSDGSRAGDDVGTDASRARDGVGADASRALVSSRSLGAGSVLGVWIDVGRILVESQQGKPPHDDYAVTEVLGDYPGITEPDDLCDPRTRTSDLPHADVFEHALFDLLEPPAMPVIARAPIGSTGVFVLTVDADFESGEASSRIVAAAASQGVPPTVLVIPERRTAESWTADRDWFGTLAGFGAEVGLHYNRYPMRLGVWKLEPFEAELSVASQADLLRRQSPHVGRLAANRNHYLIVGDHYTRTLRELAAQGIAVDSTYGTNKGRGYAFGTGSPFLPLDTNGLPLAILEVPFVSQETWGGADLDFFEHLIEANGRRHHGSLVSIFHPQLDFADPSVLGVGGHELLRRILALAAREGHAFLTLGDLAAFERERAGATVESSFVDGRLLIRTRAASDRLALEIPWRDGARLEVEGVPRPVADPALELRGGVRVVHVPRGDVRMEVTWP